MRTQVIWAAFGAAMMLVFCTVTYQPAAVSDTSLEEIAALRLKLKACPRHTLSSNLLGSLLDHRHRWGASGQSCAEHLAYPGAGWLAGGTSCLWGWS